MQQTLKRRHLVTRRNMECFQGLAILIVVCTVIMCALQILYFFLLTRTKNVPSSRINCEDLNGHNREPGNPRKINIQWPHLNRRKQPIEHSEQPFSQVALWSLHSLNNCYSKDYTFCISRIAPNLYLCGLFQKYGDNEWCFLIIQIQILKLKVYVNLFCSVLKNIHYFC